MTHFGTKITNCVAHEGLHICYPVAQVVDQTGYRLRACNFAEAIIFKVYTRDNPDKEIVRYNDKKAINYNNFNKESKVFGGIIDIENKTDKYLVEVKSKSMSAYDFISKYPPKDEVYQALFYAYLRK